MNEFWKRIKEKPGNLAKLFGIVILAIIIVVFLLSFLSSSFRGYSIGESDGLSYNPKISGESAYDYAPTPSMAPSYYGGEELSLSQRNAADFVDDSNQLEVSEYSASVETTNAKKVCASILEIKSLEYVIFEQSNNYKGGCTYLFKVEKDKVSDVLDIVKSLKPRNITENTAVINEVLNDYASRIEILENKLQTIDETLEMAVLSYDDIIDRSQDSDVLAKVIESKINILERLTRERINVSAELDRLTRDRANQLGRVDYSYFHVSVYENKFVDGQVIKDSWKRAVQISITSINRAIQDITVKLIASLFVVLQYVIYLLIILVVVKYGWRFGKKFWKK
jgi:hypothetical protein